MCLGIGAPSGVKTVTNEQGAAYGTAIQQASAEFGDSSTAFNDLMSSMAPIAKAGPGQTGFTANEESAINAQTVDQTAAAYKNAAAAVKNDIGAQGGGNVALPSGVNLATEEQLAEAGAQQESSGLQANTVANYAQGNQNWQFAEKGIESAPQVFNPANAATTATTTSGSAALGGQQARAAYPTWQGVALGALGAGANIASGGISGVAGSALDTISSTADNLSSTGQG